MLGSRGIDLVALFVVSVGWFALFGLAAWVGRVETGVFSVPGRVVGRIFVFELRIEVL